MKTKLIFSPQLAQYLLSNNYIIVNLKPKRGYPNETVFVFKVDPGFEECIVKWVKIKTER